MVPPRLHPPRLPVGELGPLFDVLFHFLVFFLRFCDGRGCWESLLSEPLPFDRVERRADHFRLLSVSLIPLSGVLDSLEILEEVGRIKEPT